MGKRVSVAPTEPQHVVPSSRNIRKRKRTTSALNGAKTLRLNVSSNNTNFWHENDDEDSSSNDADHHHEHSHIDQSSKYLNNSPSILLNSSLTATIASPIESPKPTYTLRPSLVNGTILHDLSRKPWRLGNPIGKGNFGEIFLASDNIAVPVNNTNAKFVVKIEPHSNGPLFVEIHCLMNTARKPVDNEYEEKVNNSNPNICGAPSGIPDYIASGSHYFGGARYRFLVLPRFDRDLYSIIKNGRVHQKAVLTLAMHIVNVLECLHDKGYCHNDVKAQNLMISKCKYYQESEKIINDNTNKLKGIEKTTNKVIKTKYEDQYDEKQQTTDSGNSSEQETNEDDEDFIIKTRISKHANISSDDENDEDEDFDDGATSNSNSCHSMALSETPVNRNRNNRKCTNKQNYKYSQSSRSNRRTERGHGYQEIPYNSHNLRPSKRISYSEFFNEDGNSVHGNDDNSQTHSSGEDSEEFVPSYIRRGSSKKATKVKRPSRRSEKSSSKMQSPIRNDNYNLKQQQHNIHVNNNSIEDVKPLIAMDEERIFLIDFGLASKFMDNGVHRPFVMDQRRAHDGTLEFTSRDAHMGAHSRRSDLECLGYNLIYWSQGYLPWKEAATQHQQEKVHRAKEYLMTDVREMLKQIYGKQVPKYLGEFLHHVGKLAYHERPDYALYRRIFQREFQQLGYSILHMSLDSNEIARTCIRVKDEIENKYDIFELNKLNTSANLSICTPFHERTLSNRVSPKNLRSKSDKKSMKKKKFSWAEILSQDPDQIARERAEKEFDREVEMNDVQQPTVRRYVGNPTYAILQIQRRLRLSGRLVEPLPDDDVNSLENLAVEEDEEVEYEENDEEEEQGHLIESDDSYETNINDTSNCDEESENEDGEDDKLENEDDMMEDDDDADESDESELCSSSSRSRSTRKTESTKIAKAQGKTNNHFKNNNTNTKRTSTATKNRRTANTKNYSKNQRTVRNGRKSGAYDQYLVSAANEIGRYLSNCNNVDTYTVDLGNSNGRSQERRTRRCLHKTDMELFENNGSTITNHLHHHQEMRNFYTANSTSWRNANAAEHIYIKGNHHMTTITANPTKHYRK